MECPNAFAVQEQRAVFGCSAQQRQQRHQSEQRKRGQGQWASQLYIGHRSVVDILSQGANCGEQAQQNADRWVQTVTIQVYSISWDQGSLVGASAQVHGAKGVWQWQGSLCLQCQGRIVHWELGCSLSVWTRCVIYSLSALHCLFGNYSVPCAFQYAVWSSSLSALHCLLGTRKFLVCFSRLCDQGHWILNLELVIWSQGSFCVMCLLSAVCTSCGTTVINIVRSNCSFMDKSGFYFYPSEGCSLNDCLQGSVEMWSTWIFPVKSFVNRLLKATCVVTYQLGLTRVEHLACQCQLSY